MIKKELHIKAHNSTDLSNEAGLQLDHTTQLSRDLCEMIGNDEAEKIRRICPALGECGVSAMAWLGAGKSPGTDEDMATFVMKCKIEPSEACGELIDQGIRSAVQRTHEVISQVHGLLYDEIKSAENSFLGRDD